MSTAPSATWRESHATVSKRRANVHGGGADALPETRAGSNCGRDGRRGPGHPADGLDAGERRAPRLLPSETDGA